MNKTLLIRLSAAFIAIAAAVSAAAAAVNHFSDVSDGDSGSGPESKRSQAASSESDASYGGTELDDSAYDTDTEALVGQLEELADAYLTACKEGDINAIAQMSRSDNGFAENIDGYSDEQYQTISDFVKYISADFEWDIESHHDSNCYKAEYKFYSDFGEPGSYAEFSLSLQTKDWYITPYAYITYLAEDGEDIALPLESSAEAYALLDELYEYIPMYFVSSIRVEVEEDGTYKVDTEDFFRDITDSIFIANISLSFQDPMTYLFTDTAISEYREYSKTYDYGYDYNTVDYLGKEDIEAICGYLGDGDYFAAYDYLSDMDNEVIQSELEAYSKIGELTDAERDAVVEEIKSSSFSLVTDFDDITKGLHYTYFHIYYNGYVSDDAKDFVQERGLYTDRFMIPSYFSYDYAAWFLCYLLNEYC